jgi:hypothetical protein
MSRLAPDRQHIMALRRLALVGRWLGRIRGDEWKGTPGEVGDALYKVARHGEWAPHNPGVRLAGIAEFIREQGWEMTAGRTGKGRFIKFTRLKPGDKTNSR